jgi:RHS repeat-associated protein
MRIAYNLTKLHQSAGGSSWVTEYTYDKDNRPVTVKVNGKTITDSYNATGTRSSRVYGFATPYTVSFGYLAGANGSKTTMLQSYRNGSDAAYTYTYDNNGNVTAMSQGTKSAAYTYDALNQLTRVNDGFTNKTTTYTYDNAGNILERKEYAYTTGTLGTPTATFAYEYDSEWKDKLVSYNGETISYDEIGNPVSYRGYTMAWQGKRLESLSGDGLTASYTYDEQGIRSGKTINGVTTSFSYNGSLLMAQVAPGKSLLFSYDANGQAVSVNYNGTEYYYLRNGQNDIVGLMDESGVRVVEYIYDAWGKLISTTGTLATTLGADNPFRYRGYYYDTETGLYYLTTRYYDPEVCRFISADVYMSTGQGVLGGNMWAYCLNNPLIYEDSQGKIGILGTLLIGTAIGAAFGFIGNCITNLIAGDNILDGWALATISGAATGLLATSGLGVAGQAIGNAIISAGANIYQQSQSGGSFDWLEFGIETTLGLASGFAGGKGVLSKSKGSGITNMAYNLLEDLSFGPTSSKIRDRLIASAKISGIVTGVKSTLSGIYKKIKKGKAATCSKSFTRNKLNNSHMLLN